MKPRNCMSLILIASCLTLLVSACGASADSDQRGQVACKTVEIDSNEYCVYEDPITETRYQCPPGMRGEPMGGGTVCTDRQQIPEDDESKIRDEMEQISNSDGGGTNNPGGNGGRNQPNICQRDATCGGDIGPIWQIESACDPSEFENTMQNVWKNSEDLPPGADVTADLKDVWGYFQFNSDSSSATEKMAFHTEVTVEYDLDREGIECSATHPIVQQLSCKKTDNNRCRCSGTQIVTNDIDSDYTKSGQGTVGLERPDTDRAELQYCVEGDRVQMTLRDAGLAVKFAGNRVDSRPEMPSWLSEEDFEETTGSGTTSQCPEGESLVSYGGQTVCASTCETDADCEAPASCVGPDNAENYCVVDQSTSNFEVSIEVDRRTGIAPARVEFTSEVSFEGEARELEFKWDFGDGNSSRERSPSHTYQGAGTYTATVTATGPNGQTASDSIEIEIVEDKKPAVEFAKPSEDSVTCEEGQIQVEFEADVSGGNSPINIQWDFGDGTTSTLANPTHTYDCSGAPYTVTLTVTDRDGDTATDTIKIGSP